jgi:hypothetical protein
MAEPHSDLLINRPRKVTESHPMPPMTHTNTLFAPELGLPEPNARTHALNPSNHHSRLWAAASRSRNFPLARQSEYSLRSRGAPRGVGEGQDFQQSSDYPVVQYWEAGLAAEGARDGEQTRGPKQSVGFPGALSRRAGPVGEGTRDGGDFRRRRNAPDQPHTAASVRSSASAARYAEAASQDLRVHESNMSGGGSAFHGADTSLIPPPQRPSKADLLLAQQVCPHRWRCMLSYT